MFIAHYKNGQTLSGREHLWDDIPEGLTGVALTLPFPVKTRDKDGRLVDLPARTISMNNFDRYFYNKEAVSVFLATGTGIMPTGKGQETAEIMGGIDDKAKIVEQIIVQKDGNIKTLKLPLEDFQIAPHAIKLSYASKEKAKKEKPSKK